VEIEVEQIIEYTVDSEEDSQPEIPPQGGTGSALGNK